MRYNKDESFFILHVTSHGHVSQSRFFPTLKEVWWGVDVLKGVSFWGLKNPYTSVRWMNWFYSMLFHWGLLKTISDIRVSWEVPETWGAKQFTWLLKIHSLIFSLPVTMSCGGMISVMAHILMHAYLTPPQESISISIYNDLDVRGPWQHSNGQLLQSPLTIIYNDSYCCFCHCCQDCDYNMF